MSVLSFRFQFLFISCITNSFESAHNALIDFDIFRPYLSFSLFSAEEIRWEEESPSIISTSLANPLKAWRRGLERADDLEPGRTTHSLARLLLSEMNLHFERLVRQNRLYRLSLNFRAFRNKKRRQKKCHRLIKKMIPRSKLELLRWMNEWMDGWMNEARAPIRQSLLIWFVSEPLGRTLG